MAASGRHPAVGSRGQSTVEYIGLMLLLAVLLLGTLVLFGVRPAGAGLARAIVGGLLCAVDSAACGEVPATKSALETLYGPEVAALLARNAPDVFFEADDFASLPVDFRECRARSCADTIREGSVHATQTGLSPAAFTHVVDCRDPATARRDGYACSGAAAGNLYLQYWLYYPDSLTHGLGRLGGFHLDDWESLQVRIGPGGRLEARASSHRGYNGAAGGMASVGSDTGVSPRPAWERWAGTLHVASGSHAGTTFPAIGDSRAIHGGDLTLIPAEPIARFDGTGFAVTPPWQKEVWRLPESMGT